MVDRPPESPDDIDYDLPESAIAQTPLTQRDAARLLEIGRAHV